MADSSWHPGELSGLPARCRGHAGRELGGAIDASRARPYAGAMQLVSLPRFVPAASHPLAKGGFQIGVKAPNGDAVRVWLGGTRASDVGTDIVSPDGQRRFSRTHPVLTSAAIRDAARALDQTVVQLLDARTGASDARAGAETLGQMVAFAGAPSDSRIAAWHKLYADDPTSVAVRDAVLRVSELIHAAG